VILLF